MSSATSINGVSINSTSGKLTLNATGQTIDLDGLTVDIDATTINLDATTINSNFTDNNIIGNTNITGNLNVNAGSNRYTFPTNRPASAYMLNIK